MRRPPLAFAAGLAVLAFAAWWLYWLEQHRPYLGPLPSLVAAREILRQVGYSPGPADGVVYQARQGMRWAWDWATRDHDRRHILLPVAVVHFQGGGEVALAGTEVVRFRRPMPQFIGPPLPPSLVEGLVRERMAPIFPDLSWFSFHRLATRVEGGVTWHRLHLLARSPHFPEGWREELEVEVVGSTILAATRRLIPDSDPMGVVFGRAAELRRVRWLVYAALAMGLGGLFVTLVEAFYVHQRLPWLRGFLLGASCWGLGIAVGHSSLLSLFWAVAAFLSFLTVQGLGSLAARLDGRSVLLGVLVGAWSLLWPEVVVGLGGWVPSTGLVLTEPWPKVVGESGFRALAQELLLRGAIPFLLQPFLGMPATVLLAATAGGLLDPRPAVPLPLGLLGELAGQTLLGLWAARHGWLSALLARFFAELVRLGYHAPQFPWQEVWPALTLLALGGFLWAGKKP